MCRRLSTLSRRYCRRRVTVWVRNDEPLVEQVAQAQDLGLALERDHVDVHAIVALEVRRREQVRHELRDVRALLRLDHDADALFVIGLVADVLDHRQLLLAHLRGDLLDDLVARHLVRQLGDDDDVVFFLVDGARLVRAVARVVDGQQLRARRDDLAAGRQIGPLHVLHERARLRIGLVEQMDARLGDLAQVVRRNVGGHADGDALRAVEQHVRQARGQERRFVERAVEVRLPVDGAVGELGEQHFRVPRELALGVTHRGERLRIVDRAPVALPVHDRIAVREILRHQHHGFVAGGVPVRMELADHVADRARRFLVLLAGRQAELAHRVRDAPLHGLESIRQRRQRAVEDHVHRIVEVRLLREGAQRLLFHAFEIQFVLHV